MTNDRQIYIQIYQWQAIIHFNRPRVGQHDVIYYRNYKMILIKVVSQQSYQIIITSSFPRMSGAFQMHNIPVWSCYHWHCNIYPDLVPETTSLLFKFKELFIQVVFDIY